MGVSPLGVLNDDYRDFLDLIAKQVTNAIVNARDHEAALQREQALRQEAETAKQTVTTVLSSISTALDITDHKQPEKALQESETRLRLITDSLPVLISYVDHQQRYRFVNQTYTDWFGIQTQEFIGQQVEEILGQKAYQAIRPDIDTVLSGQRVNSEKYVFFQGVGWRYVQRYFVPDIGEGGNILGYYALAIDLTYSPA